LRCQRPRGIEGFLGAPCGVVAAGGKNLKAET
jgi:hypothetical protein